MKTLLFSLILLLFGSLLLLQSCTPEDQTPPNCDDSPPEYYYLSPGEKATIPYTGYDTICMVSNTGDTIRCIGTGKKYFNTEEFEHYTNPACAGHGTEKYYEAYTTEYVDSVKNIRIELSHYYKIFFPYGFFVREQSNTIAIIFQDKTFYVPDVQISDPEAEIYVGDLRINNTLYKKVSMVSRDYRDTLYNMYISRNKGILKFNMNTTETWELLKE